LRPKKIRTMTSEERIKKQKELVETVGRTYAKKGMQLNTGRILGLLTVMDKEQYTFDEIVEELQISKASASNALRMLEMTNVIQYNTVPGDRKRYFRIRKQERFALVDEHVVNMKETRDFLQTVLDLKANKTSDNAVLLGTLIDMLNFYLPKFEELKKEYKRK
jgi:DNA-binding transcriptional regulator GbsR (MarR family)